MRPRVLAGVLLALAWATASTTPAGAVVLKVYGGTDLTDSNLLAGLIAPAYLSASGNTINYLAMGTGAALDSAAIASNHADAVVVNSPPVEAAWVAAGNSVEPLGRALFYNKDYLVGPVSDPAGVIAAGHTRDTIAAMQDIAAAGGLGAARFNSRDNASGANVQEQVDWGLTSGVTKQAAWNAPASDTTRFTPFDGTSTHPPHHFPSWYVSTNQGTAANLNTTNSCSPRNCYTIVDSGTWAFVNPANLQIVNQDNSAGSDPGLQTNPFHAYAVSVSPNNPTDALGFLDFLTSETFQRSSLPGFPSGGPPAAVGSAFPLITANTLPGNTAPNTLLSFTATLKYAPPVAVPIAGMPVQLQHNVGGGWSDVGAPHNTNGRGDVSFITTTVAAGNECFRLKMGAFDDFDAGVASRLSPNTNSKLGPLPGPLNGCLANSCPSPTGAAQHESNYGGWFANISICGAAARITLNDGGAAAFQLPPSFTAAPGETALQRVFEQSGGGGIGGIFQAGTYTGGGLDGTCPPSLPGQHLRFSEYRDTAPGSQYHCTMYGDAPPGSVCTADLGYAGSGQWNAQLGCPAVQSVLTRTMDWGAGYLGVGGELSAPDGSGVFPNQSAGSVLYGVPGHGLVVWNAINRQAPGRPFPILCVGPSKGWSIQVPDDAGENFSIAHTAGASAVTC